MNQTQSMNGRYYRTCMNDIRSSEGWFGKICLLGVISFIPVFGQMTVSGYAYEWAHKAAWGIQDPMPKKIYGRPGSKMLRWGWFVIVIALVFALIPFFVSLIGSIINAAGSPNVVYTGRGVRTIGNSNPALMGVGGFIAFVGLVLAIFSYIFAWVGCIRMTIYDRLGTGLQFGKVWKMAKHDFGGLMRIFGMSLIWGFIISIILSVICMVIVMIFVVPAMAAGVYASSNNTAVAGLVLASMAVASPLFLVLFYVGSVAQSFLSILIARAVGYWARQFDVASWGAKDDPLPFETQAAQQTTQYAAPQQPYQQPYAQGQPFAQQPTQPQTGAYAQAQPAQPGAQPAQPMAGQPATQPAAEQPAAEPEPAQPAAQPVSEEPMAQPAAEQPAAQPEPEQPAGGSQNA